jgi:hypothetical protein
VAEQGTEGGFGTGLRAKLQSGETPVEPRSPAEAIAAAAPVFEEILPAAATAPVNETEVEALRAELNASLAREQQLRSTLSDQMDNSARDAQVAPRHWQRPRPSSRTVSAESASGWPSWTTCSKRRRS